MRALAILTCVLASACSPEIVSGAYLCGPDESCPEGQVCNGVDNTCVLPASAEPFSCGASGEVEPNDSASAAQRLGNFQCVSAPVELLGCSSDGDLEDWFGFDVPSNCTAAAITLKMSFPLAFEQLSLQLAGGQGTSEGMPCDASTTEDGTDALCLKQTVTPGGHYTVRVARSGSGNCGGACSYNRYILTAQLGTP